VGRRRGSGHRRRGPGEPLHSGPAQWRGRRGSRHRRRCGGPARWRGIEGGWRWSGENDRAVAGGQLGVEMAWGGTQRYSEVRGGGTRAATTVLGRRRRKRRVTVKMD
jgi:hypothetical protein